jgi:hypothetical protein
LCGIYECAWTKSFVGDGGVGLIAKKLCQILRRYHGFGLCLGGGI